MFQVFFYLLFTFVLCFYFQFQCFFYLLWAKKKNSCRRYRFWLTFFPMVSIDWKICILWPTFPRIHSDLIAYLKLKTNPNINFQLKCFRCVSFFFYYFFFFLLILRFSNDVWRTAIKLGCHRKKYDEVPREIERNLRFAWWSKPVVNSFCPKLFSFYAINTQSYFAYDNHGAWWCDDDLRSLTNWPHISNTRRMIANSKENSIMICE